MDDIVLETENLIFRKYKKEYFRHFCDIHLSKTVMKYFNGGAMDIKEAKDRFDGVMMHQLKFGFSYYAVFQKINNEYVGQAGLYYNSDMTLNLCYALLDQFQNRGYGTEMIIAVLKQGFEELKFSSVLVLIAEENKLSRHVVEKLGARQLRTRILNTGLAAVDYIIEKNNFYSSLPQLKHYNYRKGVGAILINNDKKVYLFKRIDQQLENSWQGVEGGVDSKDKDDLFAIYREIKEEIGIDREKLEYLDDTKHFYKYNFINNTIRTFPDGISYIGQQKKFFIFKFLGDEKDFNYKNSDEQQEFVDAKLFKQREVLRFIPDFKKDMYKWVLDCFSRHIKC